jgi:hypothetical protein
MGQQFKAADLESSSFRDLASQALEVREQGMRQSLDREQGNGQPVRHLQ